MINVTQEDIRARFGDFSKIYETSREFKSFSAIVMGLAGVGKTSFLATGRRPLLIDSFDPKGTVVLEQMYPEEIGKSIIIRTFWDEDSANPSVHKRWEEVHNKDMEIGFYNYFGTYAIDSFTTWLDAVSNRVSVEQKRNRSKQKLSISDYPIIYDHAKDVVKDMSQFDCDFILTAHLERYQDEASGRMVTDIRTYKSLQTELPLLFTEKYILEKVEVPKSTTYPQGVKYQLLTTAAGTYRASTQLGAGNRLAPVEDPNLKQILKKVGYPYDDKPSIV